MTDTACPDAFNDHFLPYGLDQVSYVALPDYLRVGSSPVHESDREQRNYARGAEAWVCEQASHLSQQSTIAEKLVICLRYFPGRYLPKADLLRGLGKPTNYSFSRAMKDPKVAREVDARGWRYALGGKGRPSYFVRDPSLPTLIEKTLPLTQRNDGVYISTRSQIGHRVHMVGPNAGK